MGNFNRGGDRGFGGNRGGGSKFGGRGGFGGNRGGGSFGDRREVTMHDAVCAECQNSCKVPFQPTSEKPVYCSDCFAKRGGPSRPSFNDSPRRDFGNRRDSRDSRPSFGSNTGGNSDVNKQLEAISSKLDKLIKAIEGSSKSALPVSKEERVEVKKIEVKKVAAVKAKKVAKKVSKK